MPRTSLLQKLSLGDTGHAVGSHLSARDLAVAEQARMFDSFCLDRLWDCLAASVSGAVAPWGGKMKARLPSVPKGDIPSGKPAKQVLRELWRLRRSFSVPCTSFASGIKAEFPGSLRAIPRFVAPWHGRVALQLGAYRGNPLAVGFRLACKGGYMNEGCCFGVEFVGSRNGRDIMSYTFAPASGRCFQECGKGVRTLCAKALPPLVSAPGARGAELEKVVDTWVRVTPEGDLCFLRQVQGGGAVEATGLFPHKGLPEFVEEYHAMVHFYNGMLEAPVSVSIIHSGSELPPALQAHVFRMPAFSAVWYLERKPGEEEEAAAA